MSKVVIDADTGEVIDRLPAEARHQIEVLTQARRQLEEAQTVDECRLVRDLATVAGHLARKMRLGTQAANEAITVRLLAERKIADLVDDGQARGEIAEPGYPPDLTDGKVSTYSDLGLTHKDVAEARLLRDHYAPEQIEALTAEETTQIVRSALVKDARRARQRAEEDAKADAKAEQIAQVGGSAKVCKADAFDWLPTVEGDLLLTDPPYMTDVAEVGRFAAEWMSLAISRIKPTGRAYVFCGAYPEELWTYLGVAMSLHDQLGWTVANVLVWHYPDTLGPRPTHKYAQTWQACLYLYGPDAPPFDVAKLTEQQTVHKVMMNSGLDGHRRFAWQKPDILAEMLVRHGSQPGDTVLDPFAGTGTHLLAAGRHGRHGIGCEVDDERLADCAARGVEVLL